MILPRPQKETYGEGRVSFPKDVTVTAIDDFALQALEAMKLFLPDVNFVCCEDNGMISFEKTPFNNKEAYVLTADNGKVSLQYESFLAARNAAATLSQLWRAEASGYSLPICKIEDAPSFEVRSFMMDLARGVGRKEEIKETIIRLALLKYNRIHFHLVDNAGVAWQSVRLPQLTGPRGDQYSMQYFKGLHELCVTLGLEVLPEIEVPAHNGTILRCYPELACEVDEKEHPQKWVLCAGNDKIFDFYTDLIKDLLEMFPSCTTIHIGGDEVNFADLEMQRCHWDYCPKCQALGFSGMQEIYYYVIKKVYDIVKSFGKEVAMWNDWIDISKPCPLPKDIIIHFWRIAMLHRGPLEDCTFEKFLEQGYKIVNARFEDAYVDVDEYASAEKLCDWLPTRRPESDEKYHSQILGGEMCAWEYGNEESYRFYRFTLPSPLGLFADRLWNGSDREYDEEYEKALTRAVLGYRCPEGYNIYRSLGTIMLAAGTDKLGIITDKTPSNEELGREILEMLPISVSDGYGRFAALYYTECLNWIIQNR